LFQQIRWFVFFFLETPNPRICVSSFLVVSFFFVLTDVSLASFRFVSVFSRIVKKRWCHYIQIIACWWKVDIFWYRLC
jgi:hypothetical protein